MFIEVEPYKKDHKLPSGPGSQYNIYGVDFSVGRGSSGVVLRWHHPKQFRKISKDQKYDLFDWMYSDDSKKLITSSSNTNQTNKRKG